MAAPLTEAQWAAARRHWEYDGDEPSYQAAVERAASEFDFVPPSKQAVQQRAKREGWQRRGSMQGIVAAAQRKADRLAAESKREEPVVYRTDAERVQQERVVAEDVRAEVLARHRDEWVEIEMYRRQALAVMQIAAETMPDEDGRAEGHESPPTPNPEWTRERKALWDMAKTAADTAAANLRALTAKQEGERKAWGLDEPPPLPDVTKLSDEQLKALARGKIPGAG